MLDHVLFGAEYNGAGRTGLDTGRLLPHGDTIRTQRAFVHPVVRRVDAGNVERTPRYAIAAADAVFLMKIDDAVRVLNDGTGCRTRFQATRIFAVHAAILANQPLQAAFRVLVL